MLNAASTIMYSVSESGVTILPVGYLKQALRVYLEHRLEMIRRLVGFDTTSARSNLALIE